MDIIRLSQKLSKAFDALEKQEVKALHNFMCCGGCASSQLAQDMKAPENESKLGAVYYTEQGGEAFSKGYNLYLSYGASPARAFITDRDIGEMVCKALVEAGVEHTWDGAPESCIVVKGAR